MKRRDFLGGVVAGTTTAWLGAKISAADLPAAGPAKSPDQPRNFFFIQLADPQLGFKAWSEDLTHEIAQFERAIAHVNRLKPAFVIISGDLVNSPRTANKLNEFDRLRATIDPSIPVHVQPGNHDLGLRPDADALSAYRGRYGADFYSFGVGRTHFINLNSQLIFAPDAQPTETARQWDWLVNDLAAARSRETDHIVVFSHYPWFHTDPVEDPTGDPFDHKNRGYFMIPLATRKAYLDLFTQHEVRATFSGHVHGNILGRSGPMEMVTSGPVSVALHSDTTEGYRVVEVDSTRLTHRYYAL